MRPVTMFRKNAPHSLRRCLGRSTALAGSLALLAIVAPSPVAANPQGGTVASGSATISTPSTSKTVVTQSTDKAIINWKSFSIGAGETTQFVQPSSSSTTLNRVTGTSISEILGKLTANGQVILVNKNGILFGANSVVDAAALIASTHDIKDNDFLVGNLAFTTPGDPNAKIINLGTISVADGGLVALVAPSVQNAGIIQARLGKVALAATNGATVDLYGDNLIHFEIGQEVAAKVTDAATGQSLASLLTMSGKIESDGGSVLLTTNAAKEIVDQAINVSGSVNARSVGSKTGSIIVDGRSNGSVEVSGSLDVSGKKTGEHGGKAHVLGDVVGVSGKVNASGDVGGGTILLGGDYKGQGNVRTSRGTYLAEGATLDASALTSGDGGKVIVWSDNVTLSYGTILARGGETSGNGGFVETSSAGYLDVRGTPDASARNGSPGTWLLDPYDVLITDISTSSQVVDACTTISSVQSCSWKTNIADALSKITTSINGNGYGTSVFYPTAQSSVINISDIESALNNGVNVAIRTTGVDGITTTVGTSGTSGPGAGVGFMTLQNGVTTGSSQGLSQAGNITVNGSIDKTSGGDAELNLAADGSLTLTGSIVSTSGKLGVTLNAVGVINNYASINTNGGNFVLSTFGGINSTGSLATSGGALYLYANAGNVEFNSSSTRSGDMYVYTYGGQSQNVNITWGSDRVEFTHTSDRANIPTNGIRLTGYATTTVFNDMDVVFNNNSVELLTSESGTHFGWSVNNGVWGAAQAVDGVPELVNFDLTTFNTGTTTARRTNIVPYFEVKGYDGTLYDTLKVFEIPANDTSGYPTTPTTTTPVVTTPTTTIPVVTTPTTTTPVVTTTTPITTPTTTPVIKTTTDSSKAVAVVESQLVAQTETMHGSAPLTSTYYHSGLTSLSNGAIGYVDAKTGVVWQFDFSVWGVSTQENLTILNNGSSILTSEYNSIINSLKNASADQLLAIIKANPNVDLNSKHDNSSGSWAAIFEDDQASFAQRVAWAKWSGTYPSIKTRADRTYVWDSINGSRELTLNQYILDKNLSAAKDIAKSLTPDLYDAVSALKEGDWTSFKDNATGATIDIACLFIGAKGTTKIVAKVGDKFLDITAGFESGVAKSAIIESVLTKSLRTNLIKAGDVPAVGEEAHHIIAWGKKEAQEARDIIESVGININDPINGVFLPKNASVADSTGKLVHPREDAYYTAITKMLEDIPVKTEKTVKAVLQKIKSQLENGTFKY